MANATRVVSLVVALTVGAIVASFMLPIGIDALVDDGSTTVDHDVGEAETVVANLNATLTSADGTTASVDLNDTETGDSATVSVNEGTNSTATINGEEIVVSGDEVGTGTATLTYEYPRTFGFSDGAASLWNILDVLIVLAVFLTFLAIALAATNRL